MKPYTPKREYLGYNIRQNTGKMAPKSATTTGPEVWKTKTGEDVTIESVNKIDPRAVEETLFSNGFLLYRDKKGRLGGVYGSAGDLHNWVVDFNWFKIDPEARKELMGPVEPLSWEATGSTKPTKEMLNFFKQRTQDHINRVIYYMEALKGFEGLSTAELAERALAHDEDKYNDSELLLPYIWVTEYYRVKNGEGEVSDELQKMYDLASEATGKHVEKNLHHPEAHSSTDEMTLLDLAEMVCDWFSMAEELGEDSARGWADENIGNKWQFSPEQTKSVYDIIDWLEEADVVKKQSGFKKIALTRQEATEAMKEGIFISVKPEEEAYIPPNAGEDKHELLGTIISVPDKKGFVTVDIIGYRNGADEKWRLKLYGGVDANIENLRFVGQSPRVAEAVKKAKVKLGWSIYPNTDGGAVNYAVEAIPEVERAQSYNVRAKAYDQEQGKWIVFDFDQRKAYLVDLKQDTHKEITYPKNLKAPPSPEEVPINSKTKEAVWPFKGELPKKFSVPKDCVCTEYGMDCASPGTMTFEKTKEGWKVQSKLSPLQDNEAKFIYESCGKKAASVKKTAQRELDTAIHGIHPDRLKELKDDPSFQKHAQTVADYYVTPIIQLCDQIDKQMKLVSSKPIEAAMWALSVPDAALATYQPLVKAAEYTSREMVKWFGQQKKAKLITQRTALQAPKVELDPEYQKLLKQDELLNILNILPITKKKATQLIQQFTAPLLAFCKDAKEAKQNTKRNPFLAIMTAVHLPEALVKRVGPAVKESDRAAKQFRDWMFKTKDQMEQKVPGGGKKQVRTDLSASSRKALRARDPESEQYLELTEREIKKMRAKEFYSAANAITRRLMEIKDQLDVYEAVFKRMRATRLMDLVEKYSDKILEFEDVVMTYSEGKKRVDYKKIVQALVEADPELEEMVEELEEGQKELAPVKRLLKHRREEEPPKWKEIQRRKLQGALPEPKVDVRYLYNLLTDHVNFLDTLIGRMEEAAAKTAKVKEAKLSDPQLKKVLTWSVRRLREVDWGKGPEGQLEILEQVSDVLAKAGIEPVDVDLAISEWTKDTEKAKRFIEGPSGRGTNKGALGDLQDMLTGLKTGQKEVKITTILN